MKLFINKQKRKAVSPVLATVILIAITLIAAVAVAGFVFGLFGSFTSTAQVSAGVVSCTAASPAVCTLILSNTGTAAATVSATCTINVNGVTQTGTASATGGGNLKVNAGTSGDTVKCALGATVVGGTSGSQVVGTLTLSNGGSVQFSGTWS